METKNLGLALKGCLLVGLSSLGCDPKSQQPGMVASPDVSPTLTPAPTPRVSPAPSPATSPVNSPNPLSSPSSWLRVWLQTDCTAQEKCPSRFGFGVTLKGYYFFGPEETMPAGSLRPNERSDLSQLATQVATQDLSEITCTQNASLDERQTQAQITLENESGVHTVLLYSIDLEQERKCYRGSVRLAEELITTLNQIASNLQGRGTRAPSPSPSPSPSPRMTRSSPDRTE